MAIRTTGWGWRASVLAAAVVTAGLSATACSAGSDETTASSQCDRKPTSGTVARPAQSVDFASGTAAFTVKMSDGTSKCVVAQGQTTASWNPDGGGEAKLDLRTGNLNSGLYFSVTDRSSDTGDDIPTSAGKVPGAFLALAVDGNYFNDGWETQCSTTLTTFDATTAAGTFTCKELTALGSSGAFDAMPSTSPVPSGAATPKVESASGWFEFAK